MAIKIPPVTRIQEAIDTPFDPTGSTLTSTDVESAIKELDFEISVTATPGFMFGRSGNVGPDSWLLQNTIPSNLAGISVPLSSAVITEVFSSNPNTDTYNLGIYSHDGNSINLTLLYTLTVTAARGNRVATNISVAQNKQLAVKVLSGSVQNVAAGVVLRGTAN